MVKTMPMIFKQNSFNSYVFPIMIGGLVLLIGLFVFFSADPTVDDIRRPDVSQTIVLPAEDNSETTLIHGTFETQGDLQQTGTLSGQENGENNLQDAGKFTPEELNGLDIVPGS